MEERKLTSQEHFDLWEEEMKVWFGPSPSAKLCVLLIMCAGSSLILVGLVFMLIAIF